jgi:serine O-acetyltransferase
LEGKRRIGLVSRKLAGLCRTSEFFKCAGKYAVPSDESVKEILSFFQEILFIGYFGKQSIPAWELESHLNVIMSGLYDDLATQIAKSLRHRCEGEHAVCDNCMSRGETHALRLVRKIPDIRKMLEGDVRAAFDGDPAAQSFDEVIFSYPGIKAIMVHRVAHELYAQDVPLLPRIMSEYAHALTGIDIHPGARIGRSFFIDHGTGVVIGETTLIGNRVKIYQGVTLGALSFPKDERGNLLRGIKRHPTLEDDVTIYAGATVLGGDTVIGRGSTIGGNVWITRSVPPGTKVVIEPPELNIKADLMGHVKEGTGVAGHAVKGGKKGAQACRWAAPAGPKSAPSGATRKRPARRPGSKPTR